MRIDGITGSLLGFDVELERLDHCIAEALRFAAYVLGKSLCEPRNGAEFRALLVISLLRGITHHGRGEGT
jgi:hypothetical protein